MGENVMTLMRHHSKVFLENPDTATAQAVRTVLHLKQPTLTDFDHLFTCFVGDAPPFPFPDVHEYYTWASSHEIATEIRVPCLTINSAGTLILSPRRELSLFTLPHRRPSGSTRPDARWPEWIHRFSVDSDRWPSGLVQKQAKALDDEACAGVDAADGERRRPGSHRAFVVH